MTYSYDPTKIRAQGKDQLRFELGDTLTDRGAETCALSDEEYWAVLGANPAVGVLSPIDEPAPKLTKKAWLYAKLYALEAIMIKLSYQVNTKIDVLSYDFGERAKQWQDLYKHIQQEIRVNAGMPMMDCRAQRKPPYFYGDMEANYRAKNHPGLKFPFRKMTE